MTFTSMHQKFLFPMAKDRRRLDNILFRISKTKTKLQKEKEEYYNEEKDRLTIKEYYKNIDFETQPREEVFQSLHDLITKTHINEVNYNPTEYVYPWVDLQPDGTLTSIYSGQNRRAEDVIKEDYETALKREQELEKQPSANNDSLKNQVINIENNFKFNCEHVVPQSWFQRKEPMRGDIHHLFTCDPVCNSIRSNFPYYDFKDYDPESARVQKVTKNCGKAENELFEPEYAKGAVSRAMLYFLLRYPNRIERSYYKQIHIDHLLSWHEQFPVSVYEKHRNQATYEIQGNRNPIIDFPEIAPRIFNP
ncbi:endonuclease I family protein [Alteribacillus bidgolensis]|uniref:Endonuclease I n=1 Tax=Alteribacillus bidgolensis TaxID=930129 RepID=A0A1G8G0T1_9BACI|nr:endonuclease [Alteribacillus bidgolensis]SDH87993.1 Endonuclease I [Alteribacillus bidgolensis]